MTDLEQRAWGHYWCDVYDDIFHDDANGTIPLSWETLPKCLQESYLSDVKETELHTIQLVYFKVNGKYYTEGKCTIECPCYEIGKTVALMLAKGKWLGLTKTGNWHHFDVLIRTLPENENLPADHPNYIVPIFLRNERIMDHAY